MSAISVFWDQRRSADVASSLARMQAVLEPHGRDRSRVWTSAAIGLGFNQRVALPEDQFEREPVCTDGLVIVADLRLDNRDDLASELDVDSYVASQMADSAWLRLAWRRWGAGSVERLIGEFAFAVWNDTEKVLTCARDPLGRRPLFYSRPDGALAVASMPGALLALPGLSHEIDEQRLARRLMLMPPPAGRSFFRDVATLPPGHLLRATMTAHDVRPYRRFERRTVRHRRDEDYVDHFRHIFDQAVRSRLRGTGPVASALSAGLDSGSVTATAARQLAAAGKALTAVTWCPLPGAVVPDSPQRITDESPYASAVVAAHPNVSHLLISAADASLLPMMSRLASATTEPVFNPANAALQLATAEALRDRGCRVLLWARGGNQTISYDGRPRLSALFRHGHLFDLAGEVLALRRAGRRQVRGSVFEAVGPSLPPSLVAAVQRLLRPEQAPDATSAIHPGFADAVRLADGDGARSAGRRRLPVDSWAGRVAHFSSSDDDGARRAGLEACYGVELRDPTLDIRVIEYCLAIPDDQFFRHGQMRWLIRRAMRGVLPETTLDQQRRGLQSADWPRFVAPYRIEFLDYLDALERMPLARRALDLGGLRRLVVEMPETWRAEHERAYSHKLLRALAAGTFIERWGSGAQRGPDLV